MTNQRYRVELSEFNDLISVKCDVVPGVTANGFDCTRLEGLSPYSPQAYRQATVMHFGDRGEWEPEAYTEALSGAGWELVSDWFPCDTGGLEAWVEPAPLEEESLIEMEQQHDSGVATTLDSPEAAGGGEDRLAAAMEIARQREADREYSRDGRGGWEQGR